MDRRGFLSLIAGAVGVTAAAQVIAPEAPIRIQPNMLLVPEENRESSLRVLNHSRRWAAVGSFEDADLWTQPPEVTYYSRANNEEFDRLMEQSKRSYEEYLFRNGSPERAKDRGRPDRVIG